MTEAYRLSGETAELVNLTASAFRVIDDILDENVERRIVVSGLEQRIPALWTEIGIWPAAFQAFQAIAYVAAFAPYFQAFAEMVRRVMDAVKVKLNAEEKGQSLTREEYMTTLEKETAFRTWTADLAGLSVQVIVQDAIRAQLKTIKGGSS